MKHHHTSSLLHAGLLACLPWLGTQAQATPLVLDDFAAPAAAQSVVAASQQFTQFTTGLFAGQAGQQRDAYYWLYTDPAHSGATATMGGGAASVRAGDQAVGEFGFGYGAYAPTSSNLGVQGPALGLDLSAYNDLQALFRSADRGLNLIVSFYTANPHLNANGDPLYYWDGELDIAPAVPGGPVMADLRFTGGDAEHFNFSQVDGIFFLIDRATAVTDNAYDLNLLQFIHVVPEPGTAGLLLAGLLVGGFARRRRR
jgi:hypothetical protein